MERPNQYQGRSLRVLFLSSHFVELGGAEKNVLSLIGSLRGSMTPYLASLHTGPLANEIRRLSVPVWDLGLRRIFSFRALMKGIEFARFLRRERIDAVVTYHHDADIWGGLFALLARRPAVISSRRDMGYQINRKHVWCYRLLNRFFDRIIAVSDAVKREIVRREWASPDQVEVVYNGVAPDLYGKPIDVASKRRELGLDPEARTVGMVASFRPIKGQEFFVRAAAQVLKQRPGTQFVIVGYKDREYYPKVAKLIEDLGLQGRVHCLGRRGDVPEVLKTFDVFVISSHNEGFSNAIVEAMAAGVYVIASGSGGNPEAVLPDQTGALFEPRNSGQLAEAILKALADDSRRHEVVANARARLHEKFTLDVMLRETFSVMRQAVSGRTAGGIIRWEELHDRTSG